MGKLFRYDSPIIRFLSFFANMVILNLLWLLCCLPVITAGASTAAAYRVCYRYVVFKDDAVIKPFFQGFKECFWQGTLIWVLQLAVGAMLAAECFYLLGGQAGLLWIVMILLIGIFSAVSCFVYTLISRYETTVPKALYNSLGFVFHHPFHSLCAATIWVFPLVLLAVNADRFWMLGLAWGFFGFAVSAYFIVRIVLMVLSRYDDTLVNKEECE